MPFDPVGNRAMPRRAAEMPERLKARLLGLALVGLSAVSLLVLTRLVALSPAERWTPLEVAVGLAGVLAEMAGVPLLLFGIALFAPTPRPVRNRHFLAGDIYPS